MNALDRKMIFASLSLCDSLSVGFDKMEAQETTIHKNFLGSLIHQKLPSIIGYCMLYLIQAIFKESK